MSIAELLAKAEEAYDNRDLETALEYYLLVYEQVKDDVWLLITIALLCDELGKYDDAITFYEEALQIDATNPITYYGLAIVYENLKDYDKAISYYKEAIAYWPEYTEAHFFLANLYDDIGETNLAIYHYQQAIESDPKYFFAYLNLGSVYENLNENEQALECFEQALKLRKDNHLLYYNFGVVYRKLNRIEESIKAYEKCLEIEPTYANAYLNLALLYKDFYHDLDKAIEIYSQGLQYHPFHTVLLYNRACCYALLKLDDLALQDLKKVIELDPSFRDYILVDDELSNLHKFF